MIKKELRQHKYGENGFKHKPRFGLIIEVESEQVQVQEYENLVRLGYKPRVVVV